MSFHGRIHAEGRDNGGENSKHVLMSKLNRRSDHSSRWRSFDNFISSWRPATEENFQWKSWRDSSLAAIELKERIDSERSVARETASLRNPCFYSSRFAFLLLFHLYFTFYRFCFPSHFAFRFFFFFFFFFVYDSRILHSTILFFSFFFYFFCGFSFLVYFSK